MNLELREREKFVDILLNSLDYGLKKEDTALLDELRLRFNIPATSELRHFLIERINFSELVTEVINLVQPFSKMLQEIYNFLADYATTILKADQLSIELQVARQKLSFDLSSFPRLIKEVLEKLNRSVLVTNRDAFNKLAFHLEELINYCRMCVAAEAEVHPYQEEKDQMLAAIAHILRRARWVLEQHKRLLRLVPDEYPRYVDVAGNEFRVRLYEYHLGLCERSYAEAQRQSFYSGWEPDTPVERIDKLKKLLQLINNLIGQCSRIGVESVLVRHLIHFLQLPFWKHRWRVFELWALFTLISANFRFSPQLNLKKGVLTIQYGRAREPVAWLTGDEGRCSEVWFQKYSKHLVKKGRHIEPDITFTSGCGAERHDLILIECKERYRYPFSEIQVIAENYSTGSPAQLNLFLNYDEFRPAIGFRELHIGGKRNLFADVFRPNTPQLDRVLTSISGLLVADLTVGVTAIILDTSGSMKEKDAAPFVLDILTQLTPLPTEGRYFTFANSCSELSFDELAQVASNSESYSGGTELAKAVQHVLQEVSNLRRIVVISDMDVESTQLDTILELLRTHDVELIVYTHSTWMTREVNKKLASIQTIKVVTPE